MEEKSASRRNRAIVISAIAVICIAAAVWGGYTVNARNAYNEVIENYLSQLEKQAEEMNQLKADIQALSVDSYLKADINEDELKAAKTQLSEIKEIPIDENHQKENRLIEKQKEIQTTKNDTEKLLVSIQEKFTAQTAVNALFQSPALTGKITAKKPVLAKSTDKATYEKTKKAFYQKDASLDEWQKAINSILEAAETQLAQQLKKTAEKKPSPKTTAKASSEDTSISKVESTPVPVEEDNGYYEEPSYSEPTYEEPSYEEPSYEEPTYVEPSYEEPTYEEPEQPSYEESTPPASNPPEEKEPDGMTNEEIDEMTGGKGADIDTSFWD